MIRHLDDEYSPLYFLAALGAGGVAVSFFLYPMFMVKHPGTPLVTFNHLWPLLTGASFAIRGLVAFAMVAMAYFSVLHFRLLIWNIREYRRYRSTDAFTKLTQSNKEVGLMTIPLTLAMSINVCFVIGAVFVPNLWSVVEYLFPFAILGFLAVGAYALKIYTRFLTRVLVKGSFDFVENNSLEQMIVVFTLAMISVGLAAPGAMSHHPEVNAIGIFFSILFASMAVLLGFIKFVLGFKSMLRHGVAPAGGATLWILIPILTLLGIAMIRMHFGLHHGFKEPVSGPGLFVLTSIILSLQILFGMIGYLVMKSMGYFNDYLQGDERHPGSFTLVCPGVAFFVFGMFFIVFGLERNGLVERFSLPYFIILAPFVYVQIKTILTITKLNRKLLHAAPG